MQELQIQKDEIMFEKPAQVLEIIEYPNTVLNKVSDLVMESIPDSQPLQSLMNDMVETAKYHHALGLAAIQVGVPLRVMVISTGNKYVKIVNPIIRSISDEFDYAQEGCLSFKYVGPKVSRAKKLTLEYFNEDGIVNKIEAEGLLARAIQHEMEHLQGKTFLDSINSIQRESVLNKLKKIKRKLK